MTGSFAIAVVGKYLQLIHYLQFNEENYLTQLNSTHKSVSYLLLIRSGYVGTNEFINFILPYCLTFTFGQ